MRQVNSGVLIVNPFHPAASGKAKNAQREMTITTLPLVHVRIYGCSNRAPGQTRTESMLSAPACAPLD